MPTTMKHCPECHAPNPTRLARCYACGADLDAQQKPKTSPSTPSFPCANCDAPVPIGAGACPSCGRVIVASAGQRQLAIARPGWTQQSLPDGTVLLARSGWGKLLGTSGGSNASSTVIVGLGMLIAAAQLFFSSRRETVPVSFLSIVVIAVVLLLLGVLWLLFGHEELRVGANSLEHRLRFASWNYRRQITDGILVLTDFESWTSRGSYHEWKLVARGAGGEITLERERRNEYQFLPDFGGYSDDLRLLGNYIATETGWNFHQPSAGRWS